MSMTNGEIEGVFAGLDTKLRNLKYAFGAEFTERVQRRTPVITGHLRDSWLVEYRATDVEISNTAYYAYFVEYGTPVMAPRGMLRATLLEGPQILDMAKEKVGLK